MFKRQGWSVSISGSESLNLQAGESQKLRLDVTANKPGKGTISLSISGASEVANSETEIELASEGESSDDSSSAVEILFWAVWIIIPILAVFAVVILKKKPGISSNGQNLTQNYQTTQTNQQSNVIPCFLCRQPILSQMRGCPSCERGIIPPVRLEIVLFVVHHLLHSSLLNDVSICP